MEAAGCEALAWGIPDSHNLMLQPFRSRLIVCMSIGERTGCKQSQQHPALFLGVAALEMSQAKKCCSLVGHSVESLFHDYNSESLTSSSPDVLSVTM